MTLFYFLFTCIFIHNYVYLFIVYSYIKMNKYFFIYFHQNALQTCLHMLLLIYRNATFRNFKMKRNDKHV